MTVNKIGALIFSVYGMYLIISNIIKGSIGLAIFQYFAVAACLGLCVRLFNVKIEWDIMLWPISWTDTWKNWFLKHKKN